MITVERFKSIIMPEFKLPEEDWLRDGRLARTIGPTNIHWEDELKRLWHICINDSFLHDGASVPLIARWVVDVWGPALYGALPHDWLYRTMGGRIVSRMSRGTMTCEGEPAMISRMASDQIMLAGFSLNYPRWRAKLAFKAVRLRGKRHWGGPVPGGHSN